MASLYKIRDLTIQQMASICDRTFLLDENYYFDKAKQTGQSSVKLKQQAFQGFLDFSVNSDFVPYALCVGLEDVIQTGDYIIKNRGGWFREKIKIASVIGFPNGPKFTMDERLSQISLSTHYGVDEVDVVLDYESLKAGKHSQVLGNIYDLAEEAHKQNLLIKLILETSELSNDQIIKACEIAEKAGVDFVKTSTGYSSAGAKPEPLKIMREHFPRGVKMSGGINDKNVYELLEAASGRTDGLIDLDPMKIRIGESSLLSKLKSGY